VDNFVSSDSVDNYLFCKETMSDSELFNVALTNNLMLRVFMEALFYGILVYWMSSFIRKH